MRVILNKILTIKRKGRMREHCCLNLDQRIEGCVIV